MDIARCILAYLDDHPDAADTVHGIVAWWLLEQNLKQRSGLVREVLAILVDRGLLLENSDSRVFRMNRTKQEAIRSLLSHDGADEMLKVVGSPGGGRAPEAPARS